MKERKFRSAAEFAALCDDYFKSISAVVPVEREEWEKGADGKWIKRTVQVTARSGCPMTKLEWFTPPTVGGLCAHLGISRHTFSALAKSARFADAAAAARAVITTYLEERISDPEARNIKGVQLSLETLTAAAQKDETAQAVPMTNAERAELLREMIENGFIDTDESGT